MQDKFNSIENFEVAFEVVAPPAFLKFVNMKDPNEEHLNYSDSNIYNSNKEKAKTHQAAHQLKKAPLKRSNAMKNIFDKVK